MKSVLARSTPDLLRSTSNRPIQQRTQASCLIPKGYVKRFFSTIQGTPQDFTAIPQNVLDRRHAALVEAASTVKKAKSNFV